MGHLTIEGGLPGRGGREGDREREREREGGERERKEIIRNQASICKKWFYMYIHIYTLLC